MNLQSIEKNQLILYKCISGSRAYGLELPTSDTDYKGVFFLPKAQYYSLSYVPQLANSTNDEVYYELGRFVELLLKNNPNLLELLATPKDKILVKHPLIDRLHPELFLSKKCKDTFAGFANAQIRKARGLNKKIVNPIGKNKKSILDFCYVVSGSGSLPLEKWMRQKGFLQEHLGLVNIPHFKDVFGVFHDPTSKLGYKGVLKKKEATRVLLSSIPKGEVPLTYMHFHEDGYKQYCREYKEYWEWVDKRNEARYQNNQEHGKNYDSKNMMHTFRLMDMAQEILETGEILVKRPNREELLAIRRGEWSYEELITRAKEKMKAIEAAYDRSPLPDEPDTKRVEALLVEMREELYS
ncbi:MAG: nucleotidyltransferase domain-containing protein [Bacteroidota bacterium]